MGSTTLGYKINDERSDMKYIWKDIKKGDDIKYAFALSLVGEDVKCSFTVTARQSLKYTAMSYH